MNKGLFLWGRHHGSCLTNHKLVK